MAEKGVIPAHLSEKIGISHTIPYRLLGGNQQWTNSENVARFAVNLSSYPHNHARLLAVKLEDEINIPGPEKA